MLCPALACRASAGLECSFPVVAVCGPRNAVGQGLGWWDRYRHAQAQGPQTDLFQPHEYHCANNRHEHPNLANSLTSPNSFCILRTPPAATGEKIIMSTSPSPPYCHCKRWFGFVPLLRHGAHVPKTPPVCLSFDVLLAHDDAHMEALLLLCGSFCYESNMLVLTQNDH